MEKEIKIILEESLSIVKRDWKYHLKSNAGDYYPELLKGYKHIDWYDKKTRTFVAIDDNLKYFHISAKTWLPLYKKTYNFVKKFWEQALEDCPIDFSEFALVNVKDEIYILINTDGEKVYDLKVSEEKKYLHEIDFKKEEDVYKEIFYSKKIDYERIIKNYGLYKSITGKHLIFWIALEMKSLISKIDKILTKRSNFISIKPSYYTRPSQPWGFAYLRHWFKSICNLFKMEDGSLLIEIDEEEFKKIHHKRKALILSLFTELKFKIAYVDSKSFQIF